MKIIIDKKHIDKLNEAIKSAEGRATVRTVKATDIIDFLDTHLKINNVPVPKCHLDGTTVYYTGGQVFPSAYKYTPDSTHWTAENHKGKWYLVRVERYTCPNCQYRAQITYSEAAQAWIMKQISNI